MGCNQSKIENEETVQRCKERKIHMKDAVGFRNAFAAAHSAYAMALKNTGAALSDYAVGEVENSSSPSSIATGGAPILPQPPVEILPPPPPLPPPLPPFAPLQRAATMPEMSFPKPDLKHTDPILEEEDEDEMESESVHGLKHRTSKSSVRRGGISHREVVDDEELRKLPPSPPPAQTPPPPQPINRSPPPPPPEHKGMASWDYFFPSMENVPGPTLAEVDEGRQEREEFERKVLEERAQRSEINSGGRGGEDGESAGIIGGRKSGGGTAEVVEEEETTEAPPPLSPSYSATPPPKIVKRVKQVVPAEGKRNRGPVNLVQIFNELDDCFLQASESAHEVSKMLEAARLHYHSNFADNRGNIDHSARVLRVITWNRSFRGLPNNDYDGNDDFDAEEHETHATVLDKMLAWEKKLYDEVKAGEQMKIDYQRKVAALTKLKKRGASTESLERMKSAVSNLHTRYIVDMQSMDSTVSEINRLRDEQLYSKLVALVDGMATMWESMREHHENQTKTVYALRYLQISQSPKETSEYHHERTCQLNHVVTEWHTQFDKLMKNQKDYIRSLNNWLRLNLVPIDTNQKEKVSSPQRTANPPISVLLHAWNDYLEKVPDELARTAINNFAAVVSTIIQYQLEEKKLRDRCEETRRELNKKVRQFEDWYNKYMQRRTPPDEMDPERAQDKDEIVERQVQVDLFKKRLEEEEDEYRKQCVQVREKSLTSLKSRLPEVFRAMTDFSLACSDMYRNLRSIAQQQQQRNRNAK